MPNANPFKSPIPSIPYVVRCVYQYIANHPLFINPPVYHPTTKEQQFVKRYRLYSGINLPTDGLSIAVFPYSREGLPSPASASVSAVFDPYSLGNNFDKVTYFVMVGFYYNEIAIGNLSNEPNLIEVPEDADFNLPQDLILSSHTKRVELEINPAMDIIGEYLALTRLIISDPVHRNSFPIRVSSFEVLYENLKSLPWEKGRNIFFQEGFLMLRLDAHISRGWRDKFDFNVHDFNVNIN